MAQGHVRILPTARPSMGWKRPLFAIVAVAIFFAAVEGVLWAAGVRPLLDERDPFQGFSERVRVFELEPQHGIYRTPRRALAHSFNDQQFLADKPDAGYRIFVIGGSSAFGFPWGAELAFPAFLGRALDLAWPERHVEAVNAAAMSYGSHRLRILTHELLRYAPDALVVYTGHNEFVERRFHARLTQTAPELGGMRALLYRTRLFSAMTRLYEDNVDDRPAPQPGERTTGELLGLDVAREYSVDVDAAEAEQVRHQFEANLRDIVERATSAGVRVVLCTAPSNLRDWKPNQSIYSAQAGLESRRKLSDAIESARRLLEQGRADAALAALLAVRSSGQGYADWHFVLGRAYEGLGQYDAARLAFVQARDNDAQPARAISAFNETVHRIGEELGVLVVDVERQLELESPHGLLGFDLFEDYVHPTPRGHRLIALGLWQAMQREGFVGSGGAADESAFWAALGRTRGEALAAADAVAKTPKNASMLFNLAVVLENQGMADEAIEHYRACLELNPAYYVARSNLGRLLYHADRFDDAAVEHRLALQTDPRHVPSLVGLGEALLRLGRIEEALDVLTGATTIESDSSRVWKSLGGGFLVAGRYAEAEAALRTAIELDPGNAPIHANLGFALLYLGNLADAEVAFRRSIELQPDLMPGRNGLGATLTERGRLDEAEEIFRRNLEIDSGDALARAGLEQIAGLR